MASKNTEIDGVVYMRFGCVEINRLGEYALRLQLLGDEAELASRWIDRTTLAYRAYKLTKERWLDKNQKTTRQCEIVSTNQIATELSDSLADVPDYKI